MKKIKLLTVGPQSDSIKTFLSVLKYEYVESVEEADLLVISENFTPVFNSIHDRMLENASFLQQNTGKPLFVKI
ncbi:hypothetical protein [Halobacteriovorax sp. CON-3]|uniref:hypothetical protein n=1 Tax=Halobacteriovorax sp. CON-3 TaxID=3157710 RepID=UPI00370F8AB1